MDARPLWRLCYASGICWVINSLHVKCQMTSGVRDVKYLEGISTLMINQLPVYAEKTKQKTRNLCYRSNCTHKGINNNIIQIKDYC